MPPRMSLCEKNKRRLATQTISIQYKSGSKSLKYMLQGLSHDKIAEGVSFLGLQLVLFSIFYTFWALITVVHLFLGVEPLISSN